MKPITLLFSALILLSGCTGLPEGIEPVTGFDKDRYLGTWYEIARLDHSFEEGLSKVTAEYTLNDDGSIKVINRGYNAEEGEWQEAEGRAKFVGDSDVGHLKVSFFGPFYGSYVVDIHYRDTMTFYSCSIMAVVAHTMRSDLALLNPT